MKNVRKFISLLSLKYTLLYNLYFTRKEPFHQIERVLLLKEKRRRRHSGHKLLSLSWTPESLQEMRRNERELESCFWWKVLKEITYLSVSLGGQQTEFPHISSAASLRKKRSLFYWEKSLEFGGRKRRQQREKKNSHRKRPKRPRKSCVGVRLKAINTLRKGFLWLNIEV